MGGSRNVKLNRKRNPKCWKPFAQMTETEIRRFFRLPDPITASTAVSVFHKMLTEADRQFLRDFKICAPRHPIKDKSGPGDTLALAA